MIDKQKCYANNTQGRDSVFCYNLSGKKNYAICINRYNDDIKCQNCIFHK